MNSFNFKNLSKIFSAFMIVVAMASVVACTSTRKQESTGEYVDDSVITTKVKAAIVHADSLKVAEINVETYKGVVQLSGFVSDQADIPTAVKLARDVKGVVSVENHMRVK